MQRLNQNNLGTHLRLMAGEFLVAQGPLFPMGITLRRERMRIESTGYAERSFHEIGRETGVFCHLSAQLDPSAMETFVLALRSAAAELSNVQTVEDPNGTYRTIEYRDHDEVIYLCVEYQFGIANPAAPKFEAAWKSLVEVFPVPD